MDEALGLIDGCPVGQGNDHANSGCGHQMPTSRIMADRVEKHFMEDGKLLPHDPPDGEQWLDDQREPVTSSRIRASNLPVLTTPTLSPKLRSVPRRSHPRRAVSSAEACGSS
jgi:hypothetical protein